MISVFRSISWTIKTNYLHPGSLVGHRLAGDGRSGFLVDSHWRLPWPRAVASADASEEAVGAVLSPWGARGASDAGRVLGQERFRQLTEVSAWGRFFEMPENRADQLYLNGADCS
eukprot:5852365-Pyramimonas_sp.AAC.1